MIGRRCVLCDTLFVDERGSARGGIPVCPDCRQDLAEEALRAAADSWGVTPEELFVDLNR